MDAVALGSRPRPVARRPRVNAATRCLASAAPAASPVDLLSSLLAAPGRAWRRDRAKAALLALVATTRRGLDTSARPAVELAVDALAKQAEASPAPTSRLDGAWRLVWTSEREVLFLIEKGLAFVGPCGDVFQSIDLGAGTLTNEVEFFGGPDGSQRAAATLVVGSSCAAESGTRCRFRFQRVALRRGDGAVLGVAPPFGAGTFETVYVDAGLRVARDSRGDTLIVERCAPRPA